MKKVLLIINGEQPPYGPFAEMFKPLVEASGQFAVEVSLDRNRLADPAAFDAVALYIGGGEITPEQERGLAAFVNGGGGLAAVHGANAGLGQYDAYIDLIGTEFIEHDPLAPFEVTTEDGFDDILPRLNKQFRVVDECYKMKVRTDAPLRYFQYGTWRTERYPLGYVRDYGEGRVFYTALGHDERTFGHQDFQDQLLKGLRYVTDVKDNAPIRIGLVGYGPLFGMGNHHAGMIAQTHGFELAAVCDRDAERLRVAKEEQGEGITTFADVQEMAESGLIDLGIVIVPHAYHAPVAKILLNAGLHTITEKPFVVHVSEADELIALAREKGVMLSVYHNRHWDPDILTARDALESGLIGEVYSIECNMVGYGAPGQQWRDHKEISGGMLYDMGAHQFEKILQLVPQYDRRGNRINQKATLYGNFIKRVWQASTVEDYCRAYVRFDSGLEAQLVQSNLYAADKPLWTIAGTHGSIVVQNFQGDTSVTSILEDGRRTVSAYPTVTNRGWQTYYKNVSDHLLSGLPLLITPEWAKGTIQCIEGCETASRENRLVEVTFDF
jgi:predicted dehydrogenase/type 1 glutamine amidotransferase